MMNFKKDVVYYFDEMIGTYHYAYAHPMKPLRVAMTDEIVKKYELDQHFETIVPQHLSRIFSTPISTSTTPLRNNLQLSTQISISTSSGQSPQKIAPTTRTNFIASTSKRIAQSWRDCTTIASATPVAQSVHD
jgi:acetoin utilization deacetylase AcuC-like enzyme